MNTDRPNTVPSPSLLPLPQIAHNEHFSGDSRLWFYTADRALTPQEQGSVGEALARFTASWTAHNQQLKATAELFEGRIVIFMVDESQAGASGCSIDKSTHLITELGATLGVDFFNRFLFTWMDAEGNIITADKSAGSAAKAAGNIMPDTLFLDTLAATKAQFVAEGWKPYAQSWVRRVI